MNHSPHSQARRPTKPQLDLISKLCRERGISFSGAPTSARQADTQIKALLAMPPSSGERFEDKEAVTSGFGESGGATAIRADEVVGYGATARWA